MVGGQDPGECGRGSNRRYLARGGRAPRLRVRGRYNGPVGRGVGQPDSRHPSSTDEWSWTRVRGLERRGAVLVLDRYRVLADRFLVPVANRMIRVNPNAVSWAGFLAAAGAGISFYVGGGGFLGLALLLILVNSYLDALDGKIAKLAGKAS